MIRAALLAGLLLSSVGGVTAAGQNADGDLSTTSLENLTQMQISISSFARKDQDLWRTPAAVYVISRQDIERSAATSIAELLRMVPGMQVAQINASSWAVSARGFNSAYAYKLLVLIDGRTVYSEITAGAHWDQNDIPLDTVERVEVIRGPGAAVWGTNAVNGVVNIITRRARSVEGNVESARVGRVNETTTVQNGGSVGDRVQYRAYGNYTNREPLETSAGSKAFDGEWSLRGGGRVDWQRTHADWFTLSGDVYGGRFKQQVLSAFNVTLSAPNHDRASMGGEYLLGRWEHKLAHSDTSLQLYFDDTYRYELTSRPRTRTFDVEFGDHLNLGLRNDLVWGGELRLSENHIGGQPPLFKKPEYRNYLVDAFGQDDMVLIPNRLVVTIGSKIQQGSLAGFQVQPSARALWSPNAAQSLWAAISRAVVAPSIQQKDTQMPLSLGTVNGLPMTSVMTGNPNFEPETVLAYEEGYRQRLRGKLTLDLAGFFNVYHRTPSVLIGTAAFVPAPAPHLYLPMMVGNGYAARSSGVEAALSWKPVVNLSLQASYSWMHAHMRQVGPGTQTLDDSWSSPRNTFATSADWQFAPRWSLNTFVYHVDSLPADPTLSSDLGSGRGAGRALGFTRLDLHVSYKAGRTMEFDAGGTNLLSPRHVEFGAGGAAIMPLFVPRSLFLRAKWTF